MNNIADLSAAAVKHGTQIECLVEIDCGAIENITTSCMQLTQTRHNNRILFHNFLRAGSAENMVVKPERRVVGHGHETVMAGGVHVSFK